LPLSVQIAGRLGDDVGTLRLAALMEAANPWAQRRPLAIDEVPLRCNHSEEAHRP
jgi:hypothetical protein